MGNPAEPKGLERLTLDLPMSQMIRDFFAGRHIYRFEARGRRVLVFPDRLDVRMGSHARPRATASVMLMWCAFQGSDEQWARYPTIPLTAFELPLSG